MSLDITPIVPAGKQLVHGYGGGGFRVSGVRYDGSIIVFPEETMAWDIPASPDITLDALRIILNRASGIDILVVGCGERFVPPPAEIRAAFATAGVALEWMDTGAACRTYSVLMTEGRDAAAALIAIE
ncbi:MAG: Mth938-like domain-containing protein [Rhodospirillales bacterium]|nr:Mth938-like domain-containing protein [Rhodospirillales bacterium]MCW8861530.1 Mth938-like domain-containing protein [Rhodospirillales bacterium]MCW8952897.1 Mth938-like domain-containing protein [Rhodospirillales bacterium]MCW8971372.1 Mth938-like domain-containing protein [Rhodospirillales bacterium]MCW9001661.1 Mth938-like domain-containing protein [Rhodospirillales bacterium]